MIIRNLDTGAEYEATLSKIDDSYVITYRDKDNHFYMIDYYKWKSQFELISSNIEEDMIMADNEYKLTRR